MPSPCLDIYIYNVQLSIIEFTVRENVQFSMYSNAAQNKEKWKILKKMALPINLPCALQCQLILYTEGKTRSVY